MIAVTIVMIVTIVTKVIKKLKVCKGGRLKPTPFVTAKKIRIFRIWSYGEGVRLMDTPTLNDWTTVAKRDTAFYILAVLELDDDGVGWTDPIQSIQS